MLKQVINQFCLPEFCRIYADADFVCIVSLSGIFVLSSCSAMFFNVLNSLCLVVLIVFLCGL